MHNVQRFAEAINSSPKSLLFVSETNENEIAEHLNSRFAGNSDLLAELHKVVQRLEPQIVATQEEATRRRDNFDDQDAWQQACRLSESYAGRQLNVPKPAGHGEILHQLVATGKAAELIDQGVRYLSVRNIDNVPAVFDETWMTLVGYMEANDVNFLVEVSERDDKQKGGALIKQRGRWRLAEDPSFLGEELALVRREYPTDIGPVDLLCRDADGNTVAIEVKRRGEIDGVEQLTRYLDFLNRDDVLAPVRGLFVAQEIKPQAKVLAGDRGIGCVEVDYDELRGIESTTPRLF